MSIEGPSPEAKLEPSACVEETGPVYGIERATPSVSKPLPTPDALGSVDELYCRFAQAGRRYAMATLRNEADAEEVVQEAFLRLTKNHQGWVEKHWGGQVDTIDMEGFLKARLFTTIRNLCIDRIRKHRRQRLVSLESVSEPENTNHNTNGSTTKKLNDSVEALLNQMNSNWADALKLKLNGELSYQQIATVLSTETTTVSHAQVRSWIFRGRRHLESELTKLGLIGIQ